MGYQLIYAYALQCPTAQLVIDKQNGRSVSGGVKYSRQRKKKSKGKEFGVTSFGVTLLMEITEQNFITTITNCAKPGISTSFHFCINMMVTY